MKCLSCGSSVEATKENTCSYCGSVLLLETFTNLYETSGKTKNLFKFSASEENTKGLNSEERHSALHTEILLLFDRKQWSDIERIAGKAKLDYPTDYKFSVYLIIAIIAQNKLQYKDRNEVNEITSALSNPSNSLSSENLRGFLIECINTIWHKTKYIKEVSVPKWEIDNEINGVLVFISIPKVQKIIDNKKQLESGPPPLEGDQQVHKVPKDNSADITSKITDLFNKTNLEIEKLYKTKEEFDTKMSEFLKLINLPNYKKNNLNKIQEIYLRRHTTYNNLIKELNYDFSAEKVNAKFDPFSNNFKIWSKGINVGSYFINLIIIGIILVGIGFLIGNESLVGMGIFFSPILAFFGSGRRKQKKEINKILIPLSKNLDDELTNLKSILIDTSSK